MHPTQINIGWGGLLIALISPLCSAEILINDPANTAASVVLSSPLTPPSIMGIPPAIAPNYYSGMIYYPGRPVYLPLPSGRDTPVNARQPSAADRQRQQLDRAHNFSANRYREGEVPLVSAPGTGWLAYPQAPGIYPYAPPLPRPGVGGVNAPARPSNADNTQYLLQRAHQFSTDAYRQR